MALGATQRRGGQRQRSDAFTTGNALRRRIGRLAQRHRCATSDPVDDGTGLAGDPKGPLFATIGRGTGLLTRTSLPQRNAHAMIRRRAAAAGIATKLGNHSFRATGITAYLKNGGTLEKAAQMANHASTRTTQLYDRRREELSLDEVERIVI